MDRESLGGEVHARLDAFESDAVLFEKGPARIGDLVELLGAALGFRDDIVLLFEQRQRRIDSAGARRIGAAELLFDGSNEVVAMARSFGDQRQKDQPQIAVAEHPAAPSAEETAAAKSIFTFRRTASAGPAPARRAIVTRAMPSIMIVMSKHEIYPLIVSITDSEDIS